MNYEERVLRRIPLEVPVIALVLALIALIFFSPLTGLFILAGGVFSTLNFIWLKKGLLRFLSQDKRRAVRAGLAFYLLRLLLLLAVFLIIILLFPRNILAFAAGFSAVVVVFFGEAIGALRHLKQWKS